ncbi:NADP-binding protein [Dacryopinax primogenitus]|uniref:NADP-binding protein n=1 Tax=Dacryopinax primogenitus (strain DJM 731) TaxID=1858805 RepID=M5FYA6_DACPD|nr:NADP-binding protein [Dacryopinax primogenitus]EJT98536.1 NADP-binding protein [Dacryopinax primogenitus]
MAPQIWFITGTSTGFGRIMTEHVLKNGGIVVATLRKPEMLADLTRQYDKTRLLVLKLDVTLSSEIPPAFQKAIDAFDRIDVVFNNAGFTLIGESENTPENEARNMFETNYWGAVNISREAIRVFRDINPPGAGERLLQNSSIAGLGPLVLFGHYTASKHALEGFSKTLATELNPSWNIKATILPGHQNYDNETTASLRSALAIGECPGDIDKGVAIIYDVAQLSNPPLHFPLGLDGVKVMRTAGALLAETATQYGQMSEGLLRDTMGEAAHVIKMPSSRIAVRSR